jgi:hypothetical protein
MSDKTFCDDCGTLVSEQFDPVKIKVGNLEFEAHPFQQPGAFCFRDGKILCSPCYHGESKAKEAEE